MHAVCSSWPSIRAASKQEPAASSSTDLAYEQLQCWLDALTVDDDGVLVISSDSLQLLPSQLPYELLGPLMLAAVDGRLSQAPYWQQLKGTPSKCALHDRPAAALSRADPPIQHKQQLQQAQQQVQQQVQQQGLRLVGIDLQQPVAGPLAACMAAYSCLQQLSLHELNIDVFAAQALGSIISSSGSCSLQSFKLDGVFMCDMAWHALCKGIAAGCGLQSIRLHNCLCASSLAAFAAALPSGCLQLSELDLSNNNLMQSSPGTNSMHLSGKAAADADAVWSHFLVVLPDCKKLRVLTMQHCSLGPTAAAAVAQLLKAKDCSLQHLNLSHSGNMTNAALRQLAAAAACCGSIEHISFSSTGLTDAGIKPLTQAPGWISRGGTARQLRQLNIGGNLMKAAAVGQLAKAMTSGGSLSGLTSLSLAGCHAIGDEGAIALATALTSNRNQLTCLDLSSCELTDIAVEALGDLLVTVQASTAAAGSYQTPLRSPFKRKTAAAACEQSGGGLRELKLVDNQITSKGIQALAKVVSNPACSLQVLDVSWNWVGPEGMRPLVKAAAAAGTAAKSSIDLKAAAAAGCYLQCQQQQPRHITVLRECLPEYWRVEAAKAAMAVVEISDQDAITAADAADRSSFAAAGRFSASSTCSGSCCSMAGSTECASLSESTDTTLALITSSTTTAVPAAGADADKHQLWMFNTLYCTEGESSRQSSGIPAGTDACNDVCNHYADSDIALPQSNSECSSPSGSGCAVIMYSSENSTSLGVVDKHAWLLAPISSAASVVSDAAGTNAEYKGAGASVAVSAQEKAVELAGATDNMAVGTESSAGSVADALSCALHAAGASPDQKLRVKASNANVSSSAVVAAQCSNKGTADSVMRVSHTCHITRGCAAAVTPAHAAKKLVPKPPATPNTNSISCVSSGGVGAGAWPSAPLVAAGAQTSSLKTLRNMRRRVTEPETAGRLNAAAVAAGDKHACQPLQTAARGLAGVEMLYGKQILSSCIGDSANAGKIGQQQQIKAVASSSPVAAVTAGFGSIGRGRVSHASGQSDYDSSHANGHSDYDSCALKDCAPVARRTGALPSVVN